MDSPIYIYKKMDIFWACRRAIAIFHIVFQGADRSYVTGPPFEQAENVDDRVMFFPQQQQQYNIV